MRNQGRIEGTPQYWVNKIRLEPDLEVVKGLQAVLAAESLSWITDFILSDGLATILDLLGEVENSLRNRSQLSQLR